MIFLMSCTMNKRINVDNVVDLFIRSLFDGDKESAMDIALGSVRHNIANMGEVKKFHVLDIEHKYISYDNELVNLNTKIEFNNLDNNTHDLIFYDIKMIRDKFNWKIISLIESEPVLSKNELSKMSKKERKGIEDQLKSIFHDYTNSCINNKYNEASRYLINKSKKMHDKTSNILSGMKHESEIDIKNVMPIWSEGDILISRINYFIDFKELAVIVYFYNTIEGWKIYNVNQI